MAGMTLISTVTVSTSTTSIEFTSIPQTYKDLMIVASTNNGGSYVTINGSNSGYSNRAIVYFDGYPVRNYANLSGLSTAWSTVAGGNVTDFFGPSIFYLADYTNASFGKNLQTWSNVKVQNSSTDYYFAIMMVNNSNSVSAAVTSLKFDDGGTIAPYSKISLYGLSSS